MENTINIGKIIRSDSHLTYKCRVYGRMEVEEDVKESSFHFGQFVKLEIFDDITVVSVIYNSQLVNPDYGNLGPRLTTPSSRNFVTIPDFIDETAIVLDIILLGYIKDKKVYQAIPPWIVPLNTEVKTMPSDEIKQFHTTSTGEICLKYYNQLLSHTANFGPQLLINITTSLSPLFDSEQQQKLKLLQQHILWQLTAVKTKV